LIHLVHLRGRIGQRRWRTVCQGVGLHPVPQFQEMRVSGVQFAGQMQRAAALRKSVHDGHDLRTRPLGSLPHRAGKSVVDASADAAVVQHGSAIPTVDIGLFRRPLTTAATQAFGVQNGDQPVIALLLVKKVSDGKSQHDSASGYSLEYRQAGLSALHTLGNMSPKFFSPCKPLDSQCKETLAVPPIIL
jgi:hypothetical protein